MNKTEEMWYKHYKECNDIDYAQIERFEPKIQEDILRTKCLIGIIEKQEDRIESLTNDIIRQRKIIESFESGEMKAGEKYEN
jgi:hypothetical protein